MALTVSLEWRSVGHVTLVDDRLKMPPLPGAPGVYRWRLSVDGASRDYVGQARNLRNRFGGYRSPGPTQQTNRRMKERSLRTLSAGGVIEIFVAHATLQTDGTTIEPDLSNEFVRCFLENAALVELVLQGGEIVNGDGFGAHRLHDILR